MGLPQKFACLIVLGLAVLCRIGAFGSQFCRSGLSSNGLKCSGGCEYGYATPNPRKGVCKKDVLTAGLRKCLEPRNTKGLRQSIVDGREECRRCRPGWDGPACTRVNLAYQKKSNKKSYQDEDPDTCMAIGKEEIVKMQRKAPVTIIELVFKDGQAMQTFNSTCRVGNCKPSGVSSGKLALSCPRTRASEVRIICDEDKAIELCEIKVYGCAKFWHGVDTGCGDFCHCQDGVKCDYISGKCADGKDIATTLAPTTTTTTSTSTTTTPLTTTTLAPSSTTPSSATPSSTTPSSTTPSTTTPSTTTPSTTTPSTTTTTTPPPPPTATKTVAQSSTTSTASGKKTLPTTVRHEATTILGPVETTTLSQKTSDRDDSGTTNIWPTGISSTGMSSTGMSSTGMSSTGISSTGMSSTGISSTGMSSTGMSSTAMSSSASITSPSLKFSITTHPTISTVGVTTPVTVDNGTDMPTSRSVSSVSTSADKVTTMAVKPTAMTGLTTDSLMYTSESRITTPTSDAFITETLESKTTDSVTTYTSEVMVTNTTADVWTVSTDRSVTTSSSTQHTSDITDYSPTATATGTTGAPTAKTDATTAKTDATTAKTDATTEKTDATMAKTNTTTPETVVTTSEFDVTTAKTDVTTAKTDATRAKTDVTTAKTDALIPKHTTKDSISVSTSDSPRGINDGDNDNDDNDDNDNDEDEPALAAEQDERADTINGGGDGGGGEEKAGMLPPIIGVITVVTLIAAFVAAALFYRKRQSEKLNAGKKADNACVVDMELLDKTLPTSDDDDDNDIVNDGDNFTPTTDPIPVDDFQSHVSTMEKCGNYHKEYQCLPHGLRQPVTAADSANEGEVRKNRFKDISPYDDSRVILKTENETDSDYINANYIDGFAEAMAYIAAQGPLQETLGDFWHMIWNEGCSKVVMLTNLCEGNKVKCEQYWPQNGDSCTYGSYTVTSTKLVYKAHFVHRLLTVSQSADQTTGSGVSREVHQFHFTAWPDHGVPCPVALVRFWSYVTAQPAQLSGPLLVHCSAGIGRTGTYIALDMLTHQVETTSKVSIFPTVRRIRSQRVNMVQTISQYRFLHEVVAEWLACRDCDVIKDDLMHGARWKGEEGDNSVLPAAVLQSSVDQFKRLEELRPILDKDDTSSALEEKNADKNRSSDILPVEQFRVCLSTANGEDGDYINAVFIPTLSREQGYAVTQLPLQNTVTDFWRMVRDWRVRTVVRFMDAPTDQEVEVFPDIGQKQQYGMISVQTQNKTEMTPGLLLYTLHMSSQGEERAVSVYCVESSQALTMKSTAVFVTLADTLMPGVVSPDQPPVVIQCFDGSGLSCVLCGMLMVVECLRVEDQASPFLLSRLLHTARPSALNTLDQYQFMLRCVVHHAQGITEDLDTDTSTDCPPPSADSDDHVYGNV